MKRFCTECGTEAISESNFCQECGTQLPEFKQQQTRSERTLPSLSQISKRTKIIAVAVFVLFLSFFGLYKLGANAADKDRLLEKFTVAVEKEDVDTLKKLLVSGKEGAELEDDNINVMLEYWNENNYVKDDLLFSLKEQAKEFDNQGKGTALEADASEKERAEENQAFVHLVKSGKKFLFFNNYQLVVYPIALLLETNYPDATFTVDGVEVEVEEREWDIISLGTFLPGKYEVNAQLKNDFVEVSESLDVILNDSFSYSYLYFEIEEVYIETNFDGTKVFINGKDSERTISSGGDYFGPILTDGSMSLHFEVETPFGQLRSMEYTIDGSEIYPQFPVADELKDQLMDSVNEMILSYFKSLMTQNSNHLVGVTGDAKDEMVYELERLSESFQYTIGYVDEIVYDLDQFHLYFSEDKWGAMLELELNFEYTGYDEDLYPYEYGDLEGNLIYLEYDNSQWNVTDIRYIYSFSPENKKVVSFDRSEQDKHKPELKVVLNAERLIDEYLHNMVYAINYDVFYEVEPYLLPNSELYKSQKALVSNYYERGIEQVVIDFEILKVEEINANESKIRVSETIGIYHNWDYREETFEWWYYAKVKDTNYYLHKIEKAQ